MTQWSIGKSSIPPVVSAAAHAAAAPSGAVPCVAAHAFAARVVVAHGAAAAAVAALAASVLHAAAVALLPVSMLCIIYLVHCNNATHVCMSVKLAQDRRVLSTRPWLTILK